MKKLPNWLRLKKDRSLFPKIFLRQRIIQKTRNFFLKKGFQEVETPILKPTLIPESYLEVFETWLLDRERHKRKMFLATSPESSLKKLLVAGVGNCFEITKAFRNTESKSPHHNPEFTILEWYRLNATYLDIMKDCEDLFYFLHKNFKNQKLNLTPPWEKLSLTSAFRKYAYIDLEKCLEATVMKEVAGKKGYQVDKNTTFEQLFNQIFLNEIEPRLGTNGRPTIIYDYPAQLAALARLKPGDKRFAERFEIYIEGLELGDCYTELTDPEEQKVRFKEEMQQRDKLGKTKTLPDEEFLEALKIGLPPCAGIAVGLDRVAMLFTNSSSIAEVLYFPLSDWKF